MQELQKALGYTFRNEAHLRLALTHPSTKLPDNQRLEFLGDAVLEFCVSDMLYRKYPNLHEGELTARRAALVCERTLSVIARSLDLGRCLIMGHGEEQTGGRTRNSILADAVESVIAACFLDGGMDAARGFIDRFVLTDVPVRKLRNADYKTALQELVQQKKNQQLTYKLTGESGPDHDKHFEVAVLLNGSTVGTGTGSSKKRAEQDAARAAMEHLFPNEL